MQRSVGSPNWRNQTIDSRASRVSLGSVGRKSFEKETYGLASIGSPNFGKHSEATIMTTRN